MRKKYTWEKKQRQYYLGMSLLRGIFDWALNYFCMDEEILLDCIKLVVEAKWGVHIDITPKDISSNP